MEKRYIARQVIVDTKGKPYAYELLFRNSAENFYPQNIPADIATKNLIANLNIDFNTTELTGGKPAFINFPREVLLSEAVTYLDPKDYVLEVLEDVIIDNEVAEQVASLKSKGYTLAADDYTGEQDISLIEKDLSIIKIDYPLTSLEEQAKIIERFHGKKRLLAEKIETAAEFQLAIEMGYDLFQGYYFDKPTLIIQESVGFAQSSVVCLLRETGQSEIDFDKVTNIVQLDAGLTYHLLNKGNTVEFGSKGRMTSAAQVLIRMGTDGLRKWSTLMLMQCAAQEGQDSKMELALVRGLMAENVTRAIQPDIEKDDCYFVYLQGMFSIFPDSNREQIFGILNFEDNLALEALADEVLDFVYKYEEGDFDAVETFLEKHKLDENELFECYKSSLTQASKSLS